MLPSWKWAMYLLLFVWISSRFVWERLGQRPMCSHGRDIHKRATRIQGQLVSAFVEKECDSEITEQPGLHSRGKKCTFF